MIAILIGNMISLSLSQSLSVCLSAGLSVAVQQDVLYKGLAGFNGALGCMAVGGRLFTLSWRTHVFSIICGETLTLLLL